MLLKCSWLRAILQTKIRMLFIALYISTYQCGYYAHLQAPIQKILSMVVSVGMRLSHSFTFENLILVSIMYIVNICINNFSLQNMKYGNIEKNQRGLMLSAKMKRRELWFLWAPTDALNFVWWNKFFFCLPIGVESPSSLRVKKREWERRKRERIFWKHSIATNQLSTMNVWQFVWHKTKVACIYLIFSFIFVFIVCLLDLLNIVTNCTSLYTVKCCGLITFLVIVYVSWW